MTDSLKRIVFLDRATLAAELPPLPVPHAWTDYAASRPQDVPARCRDAHVVVTNKVPLDADSIAQLPELELVAVPATGTDHVDRSACAARGIAVLNCPDYSALSVPEHAIALMLALRRNLFGYWRDVAQGWPDAPAFYAELHPVADLHGTTLGIVGSGDLGARTAQLAQAFGMRVLRAERRGTAAPRPGRTPFEQVLAQADVLSLHCPLTPETRGLIGERELRAMKETSLLVNTARGGIVDEAALLKALDQGWIAGAALDVLAQEPPPPDHPLLAKRRSNLVVTPHVAWRTSLAMERLARQLVDGIHGHLRAQAAHSNEHHVETH
jgi:glycerate dehydrogenase